MSSLDDAGTNHQLRQLVSDGRRLRSGVESAPGALDAAAEALQNIANEAGDLAETLHGLLERRDELQRTLRAAANDPGSGNVSSVEQELQRVESRIEGVYADWADQGSLGSANAAALSRAATNIDTANNAMRNSDFLRRTNSFLFAPLMTINGVSGTGRTLGRGLQQGLTGAQNHIRSSVRTRQLNDAWERRNRANANARPGGRWDRNSHARMERALNNKMNNRPLTQAGQRIRDSVRNSRPAQALDRVRNSRPGQALDRVRNSTAARVGSRALGVVGTGMAAVDSVNSFREGDVERGITQGAQAVGGAMMMVPIPGVQVAGAAITAGAMIWENRDKIADGARKVADKAKEAGSWVKDKASKLKFW